MLATARPSCRTSLTWHSRAGKRLARSHRISADSIAWHCYFHGVVVLFVVPFNMQRFRVVHAYVHISRLHSVCSLDCCHYFVAVVSCSTRGVSTAVGQIAELPYTEHRRISDTGRRHSSAGGPHLPWGAAEIAEKRVAKMEREEREREREREARETNARMRLNHSIILVPDSALLAAPVKSSSSIESLHNSPIHSRFKIRLFHESFLS